MNFVKRGSSSSRQPFSYARTHGIIPNTFICAKTDTLSMITVYSETDKFPWSDIDIIPCLVDRKQLDGIQEFWTLVVCGIDDLVTLKQTFEMAGFICYGYETDMPLNLFEQVPKERIAEEWFLEEINKKKLSIEQLTDTSRVLTRIEEIADGYNDRSRDKFMICLNKMLDREEPVGAE